MDDVKPKSKDIVTKIMALLGFIAVIMLLACLLAVQMVSFTPKIV